MLDRTEQRIVGVLLEKEATVPDTYPMTENALRAGCNQLNNREPVMELQAFEVSGTLMSLLEKGWISRLDGSGRATKYAHKVVDRLGLTPAELAVLCELLVRGPQAPGALKPRVARLGFAADAPGIEAVLQKMATRPQPLVAQSPLAPRERERKWQHLLGDRSQSNATAPANAIAQRGASIREREGSPELSVETASTRATDLTGRVVALEELVEDLQRQVRDLAQQLRALDSR